MPAANPDSAAVRYSIVIPTYQRRELVTSAVKALEQLEGPNFEAIVVVDGSTDGTAEALRALDASFPLRVVEQSNAGASRARNHGARLASGEVILFLDDDMEATEGLLAAHDAAYARGADAVVGHIPVHPDAPRTFLAEGLTRWAEERLRRLVEGGGDLTFADILTGQLSVRREVFAALDGFDEDFTRGGSFGNEDLDFGRRLFDGGYRVVFAPDAVTLQYYAITPPAYLRQWHQAGCADVVYIRKHPGELERVYRSRRPGRRVNRYLWRPLVRVPVLRDVVAAAARRAVLAAAARRPNDARVSRVFFWLRDLEYWRGVSREGGLRVPPPIRVLCYHALSDLSGRPVVADYGVPEAQFRRQLRLLRRAGFTFVTLDQALRALDGRADGRADGTAALPRRPVLVTFDDCFTDLADVGLPVLREERVPAVAFAVAGLVGGSNDWDVAIGAPRLSLLDADGLRRLDKAQVDIGVHGYSHRPLTAVPDVDLPAETAGAAEALAAVGLAPPVAFAYPHGAHDERARRHVKAAGMSAAFTVTPGLVRVGEGDRYALPRIEILRRDGDGIRFLLKVIRAGRGERVLARTRRAQRLAGRVRRRLSRPDAS